MRSRSVWSIKSMIGFTTCCDLGKGQCALNRYYHYKTTTAHMDSCIKSFNIRSLGQSLNYKKYVTLLTLRQLYSIPPYHRVSCSIYINSWWRHQVETFSALLAFCAVSGEFFSQRPVTRRFDIFFDLWLNKRLSKQSWGWWFETPSCSLWRHCNV